MPRARLEPRAPDASGRARTILDFLAKASG
jgi:hypothetical protein